MTPFIEACAVAILAVASIGAGSLLAYTASKQESAVTMQGIGGTLLLLGLAMLGAILPYAG